MWEDPVENFWKRLIRQRAIEFMRCPEYLKGLRFDYDRALSDQKRFGGIWEESGTNVFQLIAEAHGETWDEEDEEKHCVKKEVAINKVNDDRNLACTRQGDSRGREHEFQGITDERLSVLEEEKGQGEGGAVLRSSEEEAPEKARGKGRGGRGDGFYSRAGGT